MQIGKFITSKLNDNPWECTAIIPSFVQECHYLYAVHTGIHLAASASDVPT
jgi:hypothetical protein